MFSIYFQHQSLDAFKLFKCQSSSVLKLLSPSEFPCFYISFNTRIHMSLHFFQGQFSDVDKCILMPDFFSTP